MLAQWLMPATLAAGLCAPAALEAGAHGFMPCAVLESRLKLSTDQETAIQGAFKRHKPALAARVETLMQARNAVLDAGMDLVITPEAWRAQQDQLAEAMYDVAKEIRAVYLEALPTLTDSQKAKAKALLKKAHGHMEGLHGRHHEMALHFVKNRLELTEAQMTTLQTIVDSHKIALKAKQKTLHQAMAAAMEMGMDPATPQGVLDQRFGTVKEAGCALSKEVRTAYLEILPQLTPEQREAAKDLIRDFRNAVDGVRKLALGF